MNQVQRYNIFKRTHKGLRSMLFEAGSRIQQTDFTKTKQAKAAIGIISDSIRSFFYHLKKEDTIIYREVALQAPYIIAMLEQNTVRDEELAKEIQEQVKLYDELSTKKEMVVFGLNLQASYFEFTAAVLQHMNKEVTVINELLWSKFTDKELVEMEITIIKQSTPDDCTWYTCSILKGLSEPEIIAWINGIGEHLTREKFEILLETAKRVLPIERWQMIRGKVLLDRLAA